MFNNVSVNRIVANEVLGFYGVKNFQPGSFTKNLISALNSADPVNMVKLGSVYPEYAKAVQMYKKDYDGLEKLEEIAG